MDTPLLALARRRLRAYRDAPGAAADTENMRQLVQLRWIAAIGQFATILIVAYGLKVPLPVAPMLAIVAAAALVNLAIAPVLRRRGVSPAELVLALMFDVGSLTLQLYLSGGATNPFVTLFLLQVVLGAILLGRRASWLIVVVTSLCFALLAVRSVPLRYPRDLLPQLGGLTMLGQWICFVMVAALLVLFVTRVIRNLRVRDERLADLRQQAAEEDHLVRMGLFASGAAHELGTPLATLAVILGDWRRMPAVAADPDLMGEIAEMQAEVQRCKAIVTGVLHSVGELPGDAPDAVDAGRFVAEVVAHWRALHPAALLDYRASLPAPLAIAADPALRQAIWNILDNAVEASSGEIVMRLNVEQEALRLSMRDRGPGFSAAVLADFGKPQRSRKGSGHGVGLFLVASLIRKLGGTVTAENPGGGGALVTIRLPLAAIALGGTGR